MSDKELKEKMPNPTEFHAKLNPETNEMESTALYEPSEPTRILAQLAADLLKVEKCANFFTFELAPIDDMRVSVTIQRMAYDADTPAKKLALLRKELTEAVDLLQTNPALHSLSERIHIAARVTEFLSRNTSLPLPPTAQQEQK